MPTFTSYTVGYHGDHAGVRLELDKPIITRSEKPKEKYQRESFEVVTTSESFNRESLAVAVKAALADPNSPNQNILLNAQKELNEFIDENGLTNPHSEADWEDYAPHGQGWKSLEPA